MAPASRPCRLPGLTEIARTQTCAAPGTPYEFNAAACARRELKNKALVGVLHQSSAAGVVGWWLNIQQGACIDPHFTCRAQRGRIRRWWVGGVGAAVVARQGQCPRPADGWRAFAPLDILCCATQEPGLQA